MITKKRGVTFNAKPRKPRASIVLIGSDGIKYKVDDRLVVLKVNKTRVSRKKCSY